MVANENWNITYTWPYNNYQHCSSCGMYYWGYHQCTLGVQYYPNYRCSGCGQQVTYNGHICGNQLEIKPKYEEHTLECGCKVKTVVVEHCDTLHKAPEEE